MIHIHGLVYFSRNFLKSICAHDTQKLEEIKDKDFWKKGQARQLFALGEIILENPLFNSQFYLDK